MLKHILLLLMVLAWLPTVRAQDDDNARDIFIRTRKTSANQPGVIVTAKPEPRRVIRRRRRRSEQAAESINPPSVSGLRPVGLGYTLYLKNESGDFVSVNSNRVFYTGQAVRLLVESNIDGYLYVFHRENDGPPKMMFPCLLAWGGDNRIWAHKPLFISPETEIRFSGNPATEILTLIVSRNPLPVSATGDELSQRRCNTPIREATFYSLLRQPCQCRKDERIVEGLRMPSDKNSRDMEMVESDPEPTYVFVNQSYNIDRLIAHIRLTQR